MPDKSAVTIILISYYGDQWIPSCIETLRQASKHTMRLLLVDNAGNSDIDKIDFSGFDASILKCETPLGFAEANNFAMVNGGLETEYVCFLNQDTLSAEGWLDSCVQCLASNTEIGALTPLISTYDWKDWDPNFLECAYLSEDFRYHWDRNSQLKEWYSVPRIPAVAMIARTDVITKVGPFDPIYGSYYEDYDLCTRIRNAGYKVTICTKGRIAHYSGSATNDKKKEKKRMRQIIRNRAIMDVRFSRNRFLNYLSYLFFRFPRRLGRSILKTSSSQPADTVIKAWGDFLSLSPRLISQRTDKDIWNQYLSSINWPGDS